MMTQYVSVNSPCINICVIDAETDYCQGCYRTVDEISNWMKLGKRERAEIILELEHRRDASGI
jgi:predicted Fe-S protein YdhL (DUF1289 family)